jgi:hypothetical protein
MNDSKLDQLDPVNVETLFEEFADTPLAELLLIIKDLREKAEYEQKLREAKDFKLTKAEEQLEILEGRINTSITVLGGESDICLDCEAVKEEEDK